MPPNNSPRLPQSQPSPVDWEGASPLQPNFVWPRPSLWPTSPLFTPWGAAPALPGKPRCQFGGKTSRRQRLLTTCGSVVGRSPCNALSSTMLCYIDLCCLVLSRLESWTKREKFEDMVALCFLSLLLWWWELLHEREMGGRISQTSTSSADTKEVKSTKKTNNSRFGKTYIVSVLYERPHLACHRPFYLQTPRGIVQLTGILHIFTWNTVDDWNICFPFSSCNRHWKSEKKTFMNLKQKSGRSSVSTISHI